MTREIRFNLVPSADDDCVLSPDDPLYEFMRTGNAAVLNQPAKPNIITQSDEHQRKLALAKEQGIKPGSPAWYCL
jgi:hypothetical protein